MNGETTSDTTPLLDWSDTTGASGYEVQCANASGEVETSTAIVAESSQYQYPTTLAKGDMVYWRVRAKNSAAVWGAWSSTWSFSIPEYFVGDFGPGGGIVFYYKGSISDGWRYLEAASSDQSAEIQWGGYGTTIGGTLTTIGSGEANTQAIVFLLGTGSYAAKLCCDLVQGGYDDWFLPSKDELNLMYGQKGVIGAFSANGYRSSSEDRSNGAWHQYFNNGYQGAYRKDYGYRVRAVRAF